MYTLSWLLWFHYIYGIESDWYERPSSEDVDKSQKLEHKAEGHRWSGTLARVAVECKVDRWYGRGRCS